MKTWVSILMASLLFLGACAPGGNDAPAPLMTDSSHSSALNSHNVSDDNTYSNGQPSPPAKISNSGTQFTVGGDERVAKEVAAQRPNPQAPLTPVQEQELAFSDSLDDFKLFRFDRDPKYKEYKRFGTKFFEFQVQIRTAYGRHTVVIFTGTFTASGKSFDFANAKPDKDHSDYKLTGSITDENDTSSGKFEVEHLGKRARIFYRAFKAYITVHTKDSQDWSKIQHLKKKIDNFKAGTENKTIYAWGQNMVVAGITVGASRFHYDILRFIDPKKPFNKKEELSDFSLDGDSIKTGRVDAPPVALQTSPDGDIEKVTMEGDGDDEDSRVFSATVKDKLETAEIMFDIERAKPATPPGTPPQRPKVVATIKPEEDAPAAIDDDWNLPNLDDSQFTPMTKPNTPSKPQPNMSKPSKPTAQQPPLSTPAPSKPVAPEKPRPAVASPDSYVGLGERSFFYTNYNNPSLPRTKRVIDAFERNYDVREVQTQLANLRGKMTRFFYYGKPFVPVIQAIAEAYDMPPAFAFMLVNESEYFTGPFKTKSGRAYPAYSFLNPSSTSAIGPFQIITGTASANGMAVEKNRPGQPVSQSDERNYFASSACGAANYLGKNMDMFKDPTLGIMAYFRGEGTILAVVRQKLDRYSDYSIGYSIIARNHMVPDEWIRYVARVVAAYFAAGDASKYPSLDKSKQLMTNPLTIDQITSAIPSSIRSPKCQAAVARIYN